MYGLDPKVCLENMKHNMLELKNISKHFDGIAAVNNVSLFVKQGEITCITGENGAGKTTLFNLITGFEMPDNGLIIYNNENVTNIKPSLRAQKGIARLFQTPRIFSHLTVLENILASTNNHPGEKVKNYLTFKFKNIFITEKENRNKAIEFLSFCQLTDKQDDFAANLSFGQKKLLGLAMLLMNNADLLLLDEIYSGLNIKMVLKINSMLTELSEKGKTFVIIEHRLKQIQNICNRIVTMEQGEIKSEIN